MLREAQHKKETQMRQRPDQPDGSERRSPSKKKTDGREGSN